MIVTTGKVIRIELGGWGIVLERTSDKPGLIILHGKGGQTFELPANVVDAREFIAAYERAFLEPVGYKNTEVK